MRDIWIRTDYNGAQAGTKDQPFSIRPDEFDGFMHTVTENPEPWTLHAPDRFLTRGALEWGPLAGSQWRLPSDCVIDLEGSGILELDFQNIPDDYIINVPWHLVCSAENWAADLDPEVAWNQVPKNECIRNGTLIGNYSRMVDRFKAKNANLMISGALLQGHAAVIENIHLKDFGAWGQEAFPLIILGCMGGPDRHVLSYLNPATHIFDDPALGLERSRISGCTFDSYISGLSNAQVTVMMITGMQGSRIITNPWSEPGPWTQLYRHNPIINDCTGVVSDADANNNQCQLATIYQCRTGEITRCSSSGFQSGVYGDFCSTFDLDVHHNRFEKGLRGVAQLLSPTAANAQVFAEQFSSDGLKIRSNYLSMIPTEVAWHGCVTLMRLPDAPATQHITNVTVDDNDMVMLGKKDSGNVAVRAERIEGLKITPTNRPVGFGDNPYSLYQCTNVEIPPAPSKKGCNPFK